MPIKGKEKQDQAKPLFLCAAGVKSGRDFTLEAGYW